MAYDLWLFGIFDFFWSKKKENASVNVTTSISEGKVTLSFWRKLGGGGGRRVTYGSKAAWLWCGAGIAA